MKLDNLEMCYKEYPPVSVMQCEGHKQPLRLALMIPALIIGVMIVILIIGMVV